LLSTAERPTPTLFACAVGVEAFASLAGFSRVGASMRRFSLAGAALFTGLGGAACSGLASGFFSTGFSSG